MIVFSFLLVLVALALLITGLVGASQVLIWCSIVASVAAGLSLVLAVTQQRRRQRDEENAGAGLDIDDLHMDEPTTLITPVAGEPARERDRIQTGGMGSPWDDVGEPDEPVDSWGAAPPQDRRAAGADLGDPRDRDTQPPLPPLPPLQPLQPLQPLHGMDDDDRYGPPGIDTDGMGESDNYDDPPDEPREENVSATDVLRTADLNYDVLVVDGRPRYHLVDCPHLHKRETVSLSLADARESGFTPCSRCKPDSTLAARTRERFGG